MKDPYKNFGGKSEKPKKANIDEEDNDKKLTIFNK